MNLNSGMKFARKGASAVESKRIASIIGAIGDPIGGSDIHGGDHDTAGSLAFSHGHIFLRG